ncbi:MAG TPA: DUF1003 domain-containing protein [Gemmatimonadaceae bacterium]|jgi:uncharacterized membrane protein
MRDSSVPPPPEPFVEEQPERRRRRLLANRAFGALKAQHNAERTFVETIADELNDIASSSPYLVLHVIWFAIWMPWNLGWFGLKVFDPFPFGLLTMIVSLEAIFLSIFILIAQKRESAIGELREELALQVNLRIEEEMTKTLQLVAGLYTRLGHRVAEDQELSDMMQPLDVAGLERALQSQIAEAAALRRRKSPGRRDSARANRDETAV